MSIFIKLFKICENKIQVFLSFTAYQIREIRTGSSLNDAFTYWIVIRPVV